MISVAVIGSGGYHPCHGFHIGMLPQFDRNFNQILFSLNMWKVFQNQSHSNLIEQKERLENIDFSYFPVKISTIPIGLFLGGFMMNHICEPFMINYGDLSILKILFGIGKGSGAALMMFLLGVSGCFTCIITGKKLKKYHYYEK